MARNPELQISGSERDLVLIGEVLKPHGIRGEVKVYPYSGRPENFRNYNNIVLRHKSESGTEIYKILESREQGRVAILRLDGVTSREAAEALQGLTVWLMKGDFQKPEPDEFYWYQLENLEVITDSGRVLGRVSRLFSTPAHDIMVVAGEGHEYMIPVHAGIILDVDEQGGKIIISPPAGLLDINK